jgi:hypothetical protein
MILTEILSTQWFPMLSEGKKADWIARNQGKKILDTIKQRNDRNWIGKTAEEVALEFEKHGGKFAPYYVKLYLNGDVKRMEDLYRVTPLINTFNKIKQHLKQKDLNRYNLAELEHTLEPYQNKIVDKNTNPAEDQRHYESEHMTKVLSHPNFEIIVPHTKETSCHLGKGTKWCTAADEDHNMYNTYAEKGNLYVIRAGKRRFQLHVESDSFMDEKDEIVSKKDIEYLSEFPEWKTFLNMLIKKHEFNDVHSAVRTYDLKDASSE